jgi:hypothetical protein
VHASQRLRAAHLILGAIGAISVWTDEMPPHFHPLRMGGGWAMAVFSIFGWGPYLISWFYSRTALDGLSRAVNVFCSAAVIVMLVGAGLYQNVLGFEDRPPFILISAGVTLSLLAIAKLCASIWWL